MKQLLSRALIVLSLPVLVVVVFATVQRTAQSYQKGQEVEQVEREVQALQKENLTLQDELRRNQSDYYVEKVAREELGLVKPGDVALVVITPTPIPGARIEATPTPTPTPEPWPDALRNWIRRHLP